MREKCWGRQGRERADGRMTKKIGKRADSDNRHPDKMRVREKGEFQAQFMPAGGGLKHPPQTRCFPSRDRF